MSRWAQFPLLAIFALVFLLTCSKDNPTESDNGNGLNVIPASTDSPPGAWISLSGIPTGDNTYYGIVTSFSKADDTGYAPVVVTDSGHYLIVPLNPSDPIGGGEVQVVITNNSKGTARPFTLTLDSLPAAPGEYAAVVSLIQEAFTAVLQASGLTRDSLVYHSPDDVPIMRVPHVIAYGAIDDPTNPNSLRAIADGTAPDFGGSTLDIDLADRLMAQMNLREYYEELAASLDTVAPVFLGAMSSDTRPRTGLNDQDCIDGPDYGITSCGALASAMQLQYNYEWAAQSATGKVEGHIVAGVLAGASLIPGSAPVVATLGGGVWVRGLIDAGFKDMLPSKFVDAATTFDPSVTEFTEDFKDPGVWTQFLVTATSNGWKLDKVGLEAILQVVGAQGAGEALTNVPGSFEEEIGGALVSAFVGPVQGELINRLAGESDLIEICSQTWSNIDCVGLDYSTVTSNTDRLDIDSAGLTYEPNEVGPDIMRIETRNIFGEDNNTGTAVAVNTNEIQVFIDPFQAEADTSEELYFSARVENALDTDIEWSLEGGGSFFPDQQLVTVFTPESPWDPPLTLRARSLANTGLREGKVESDPREDEAEIRHQGEGIAIITPGSYCLRAGEDQEFTVTYTGSSIEIVEWEIDPPGTGSIVGSGETITYRAPNEPAGNVTLSATVNDTSTGYAYVDVSSCVCSWTFEGLGTSGTYSGSGEWGAASLPGALMLNLKSDTSSGFYPPFVQLVCYGFSGEGTFPVEVMAYVVSEDLNWSVADENQVLPTLEVTTYVERDYIQGQVSGVLSHRIATFPELEYEYITFTLTFRAEFFNLDRPRCIDD